jgi:hypothetical protein
MLARDSVRGVRGSRERSLDAMVGSAVSKFVRKQSPHTKAPGLVPALINQSVNDQGSSEQDGKKTEFCQLTIP